MQSTPTSLELRRTSCIISQLIDQSKLQILLFSAGKWFQLKFYSISSWRISYFTGDTEFYIRNGSTSTSTVSIMSM